VTERDNERAPPGYAAQPPQAQRAESVPGVAPRDAAIPKPKTVGVAGEHPVGVVFADRDQEFRAVLNAAGVDCIQCRTWSAFEHALANADVGIVVLPLLDRSEYASLIAYQAAHPLVPIVLITRRDPDNLLHLKDATVDDVVYLHALQELPGAVRAALERRCLARAARTIEAVTVRDAELLTTLVRACRLPLPPRTVLALAALGGWDRRTLYQRWQKALPTARSPHDFLQWLLLLHAARMRLRHRSWKAVARVLGADRRTLEASAGNLVGVRLADIVDLRCDDWLGMLDALLGHR
jgi:hypothetical protein